MVNERVYQILMEEMTKPEITSLIQSKIDSSLTSRDFIKKVKEITADVLDDLFKTLYQHNNVWKTQVKR